MKKLIFIFLAVLMVGCREYRRLENIISSALEPDNIINFSEWDQIKKEGKKVKLNSDQVFDYVVNFSERNGIKLQVIFDTLAVEGDTKDLLPLIYIETSKSMFGYESHDHIFRSSIVDFASKFESDFDNRELLFVVNNIVNPFNRSLVEFIKIPCIFCATDSFGSTEWTDFEQIFSAIYNEKIQKQEKLKRPTISVLYSDLIYSVKRKTKKSNEAIADEARQLMQNVMKKFSNDYSVIVNKFNADFNGYYYSYDNTCDSLIDEPRPYYVVAVIDNQHVNPFFNSRSLHKGMIFRKLKGFENFYIFTHADKDQRPYFTWIQMSKGNKGFRPKVLKVKRDKITEIEIERNKSRNEKNYRLAIGVDMSGVLTHPDYKENKNNYLVDSKMGFSVDSVLAIEECKQYLNYYSETADKKNLTQVVFLTSNSKIELQKRYGSLKYDFVRITLKSSLPDWIAESSTMDDTDTQSTDFNSKTFALSSLLAGIQSAYFDDTEEVKYFDIGIKLYLK